MIVDAVTARYAGALYGLARRKNALDAVSKDVGALATEIGRPASRGLLFNPRVLREAKRQHLAPFLAAAHPLTRNFVNLLLDKGRESVLESLAAAWRRLSLEERGAVEGRVESARPLDPADVSRIATTLSAQLGRALTLENQVVPELLGGARVYAANRMIDWSVRGRLESLRRKLLEVPLPSSRPS